MSDVISRSSLIENLEDILNDPNCPLFVSAAIEQCIENEPEVENVEPAIHAKWVKKEIGINEFLCSNCGRMDISKATNDNWNEELRHYNPPDKKYCCNCGAKMDL